MKCPKCGHGEVKEKDIVGTKITWCPKCKYTIKKEGFLNRLMERRLDWNDVTWVYLVSFFILLCPIFHLSIAIEILGALTIGTLTAVYFMEKTIFNIGMVWGFVAGGLSGQITVHIYDVITGYEPPKNRTWLVMWEEPQTYLGFAVMGLIWWLTYKMVKSYLEN